MTYYISRLEMHFTALSLTFTFLYYHYEHPQTLQKIQMKIKTFTYWCNMYERKLFLSVMTLLSIHHIRRTHNTLCWWKTKSLQTDNHEISLHGLTLSCWQIFVSRHKLYCQTKANKTLSFFLVMNFR